MRLADECDSRLGAPFPAVSPGTRFTYVLNTQDARREGEQQKGNKKRMF